MQYRSVDSIILGCGNFGGVGSLQALFGNGDSALQAANILESAIKMGIQSIDTANSYGGGFSEHQVGLFLSAQSKFRHQLKVFSKVGNEVGDGSGEGLSALQIKTQFERSLSRLGVSYLDTYYLHKMDVKTPLEETLGAIDGLYQEGRIKSIGTSNVNIEYLEHARSICSQYGFKYFDYIQEELHLFNFSQQIHLLKYCLEHNIQFIAFGTLAGGLLSGKYQLNDKPPSNSRLGLRPEPYKSYLNEGSFQKISKLKVLAKNYKTNSTSLAAGYLLAQESVHAILIGPRTVEHLQQYLECLNISFSDELLSAIECIFEIDQGDLE